MSTFGCLYRLPNLNPSIFSSSLPPYVMPRCFDPLRYLRIVFTASVCWWLGFLAKRLTNDVAKAMSGLVSTMENIIDPVIPWYLSFSDGKASPSSRGVSIADSLIGVLTGFALSRWNFSGIFSMYAGWESLMMRRSRSQSMRSPR